MMVRLNFRPSLCGKKRWTDYLKVIARGSENKTCIFLFLKMMWIPCLVYAKKDDPIDKCKSKFRNRYSSWNEV